MDQREWDAGARLPRERQAEAWSTENGPESPEKPQWGTVADTGSLQPSPEALAWAQRSEAWAQQAPGDQDHSADPQVDGVGWRTETAEWMAAEQTARWRQTTEWRSASGDHGWRSTTEAWQTGGNAEGFRPPADPATRQQLAISSTAHSADQPTGDPEPAQTFTTNGTPAGWHQFNGVPPWQSAPDTRPAWQQFATPAPPNGIPYQPGAAAESTPSVDRAETVSNPPWQPAVPTPSPVAAPQPVDTANTVSSPPWRQSVAMPAQRNGEGPSWQHLIEPPQAGTYSSSGSAGLADEDDAPRRVSDTPDRPWRTGAVGVAGVANGRVVGRRRAPEGDRPTGPIRDDEGADAPPWRDTTDTSGARHAERSGRLDDVERPSRHGSGSPRWDDADDGEDWDDRSGGRPTPGGWRDDSDSAPRPQAWQQDDSAPIGPRAWQQDDSDPGWRDRSDGWRSEPDSGSWSRGEEPRTVSWRRRRVEPVDDDTDAPGWRDAGPHTDGWRRDARPPADPWAHHAPDTGFIPMSWDQPGTRAGSWRSDPEDRDDPEYRARRRMDDEPPLDPAVWRRDGRRAGGPNWPADEPDNWRDRPPVGEAATEVRQRIDPDGWRPGSRETDTWQGQAAHGTGATYRGGNAADWRRELADESDLADGEARRFGTQDFVPFRPAEPAPPRVGAPPQQSGPVGRSNGARWHEPPDTQWPPREAVTGSYARRTADSFSATSGRANLLEPDDDVDENNGGPLAAVGYTVIWYGVPVVLFVLYMLVVTGDEKAHALSTLSKAAPQFGLSLALSMLVAVLLRWISGSWKAVTVGLAAAVLGGGLATVLMSAITGNSLG